MSSVRKVEGCGFCKIATGEAESHIVFEDVVSLAFLDRRPLFAGHTLLIPKRHYETLSDLPRDLISPVFANVQLLAEAVKEATGSEGSFVAINTRVSQSIPHMHVHIVPRSRGDGLKGFFWPRHPYKSQEAILATQEAIRSAVKRLQSP